MNILSANQWLRVNLCLMGYKIQNLDTNRVNQMCIVIVYFGAIAETIIISDP